jgi:hypothetical protein
MSQQIAPFILNLDPPAIWDNYCPVLLPLGPPTLSTIIPASMGLFVPFFVFVVALFMHLYGIWTRENSSAALVDSGDEAAPMMMRRGAPPPSYFARGARTENQFFKGPSRRGPP